MKKLFKFIALPILAVGLLAGCGETKDSELCAKALDSVPSLIGFSTGKEVFPREDRAIKAADLTAYLGINQLTWKDTTFDIKWEASPADKWTVSEYAADPSRTKFMPKYGDEEFTCSLKVTFSAEGYESAVREWKFNAAQHVKPDLTAYTYYSISQLEDKFKAEGDGISPVKVYTYGKIVKTMENNDTHIYSGVYIQDGDKGIMLYAGNLSKVWFAVGFEIGDTVMAYGTLSPYSGLLELKPDGIEYASVYAEAPEVAEPVVKDITNLNFTAENLSIYQNVMVKMDNVKFKKVGTKPTKSVHGKIFFMQGTIEVMIYVNYHIGEAAIDGINAVCETLAEGDTVNLSGVLSINSGVMQIVPVDGAANIQKVA